MGFVYDPEDESTQVDPYPIYRRLRDEQPVYRQERLGFWALSRFADVHDALRDHDSFCSSQGLTWDPSAAEQAGVLPMMVTADPPQHTKLRKLVNRGFTPRRVRRHRHQRASPISSPRSAPSWSTRSTLSRGRVRGTW